MEGHMDQSGYWYADVECPECNASRLAFAIRCDGGTHYLLCVECGANYEEPPGPGDENPAFDAPTGELGHAPRWASRSEIEARGWGRFVAGHAAGGGQ
jgi:hypothetical protein